jgi:hypothetical protein
VEMQVEHADKAREIITGLALAAFMSVAKP